MKTDLCLASLLALLALAGCVSRKADSRSAESVAVAHETTLRRVSAGALIPNVTVSGSSNVVTIAPTAQTNSTALDDSADVKGRADDASRSTFQSQIPFSLAVVLVGLTVAAALVAFTVWRRGSATGAAADESIAVVIRALRNRMVASTDAAEIAALSPHVADLEAARGKLRR